MIKFERNSSAGQTGKIRIVFELAGSISCRDQKLFHVWPPRKTPAAEFTEDREFFYSVIFREFVFSVAEALLKPSVSAALSGIRRGR
jgi:hypothetical protein